MAQEVSKNPPIASYNGKKLGIEEYLPTTELIQVRIDVNASDNANAFDHPVDVTTILSPHQFNGERVTLVQHGDIKNDIARWRADNLACDVIPHQARGDPFTPQIAVERIM